MAAPLPPFTGVVLAGGRGSRLHPAPPAGDRRVDSVDKASVQVGGVSMLQRVVSALDGAAQVLVVGGPPPPPGTVAVVEATPGGGPVAGLAAALPAITTAVTVVLATDLPLLDTATVTWLRTELAGAVASAGPGTAPGTAPETAPGVVMPVDAAGTRQPLAAAYDTAALRRALDALGGAAGRSMRDLCAQLSVAELDPGSAWPRLLDVDTPQDLATARLYAWAGELTTALGVPVDAGAPEVVALVLDLARDVAHGIARPAAPVTTFLAGIAVGTCLTSDDAGIEELVRRFGTTITGVLTRHEVG